MSRRPASASNTQTCDACARGLSESRLSSVAPGIWDTASLPQLLCRLYYLHNFVETLRHPPWQSTRRHLAMWGLDQSRLLGPLHYQRVATTGENVVEEESTNSSFTRLPPIHPTEDVKSTRYTLIHFLASSIWLFASLSFFLFRYYRGISDDKCMRQFSAPSK